MATTYMGLDLPTVGPVDAGGTAGPEWATLLKAAIEEIDQHDHTTGRGKKVPVAGLSINADLDFNEQNLYDVKRLGLITQDESLASVANKNSIYVKDGELYYISTSGVNVQITSGAGLNLTSLGTIGGDFSTSDATVTYSATSKSFLFKQDSSKTADIAAGSLSIYENIAGGKYSKFSAPTGQTTNLNYTLPSALPSSVSLPLIATTAGVFNFSTIATTMITDNAVTDGKIRQSAGLSVIGRASNSTGNVADITAANDGEALIRSGASLVFGKVGTSGIADGILSADETGRAKMADGFVTRSKLASLGQQVSSSSGNYSTASTSFTDVTNLSVTIETEGRPVWVGLIADGNTSNSSFIGVLKSNESSLFGNFQFVRGSTSLGIPAISSSEGGSGAGVHSAFIPPSCLYTIDFVSAGTYTYKLQVKSEEGEAVHVKYSKLIAFEIG